MEMKYVGTFHSVDVALNKITQLKSEGYEESAIHAVAQRDDELDQLRNQSYVKVISRENNQLISNSGIEDAKTVGARVEEDIRNGGIVLFVDGDRTMEGQIEHDSQAALSESGESLQNDADYQPRNNNEATVPRLNTDGL
ncbi:general stress protein [Sporosarcina cyprini]|uniref:general stress protein n=1 Tax=Sporosarcina cyprini TaxID=2910523 RepID=UPI001EDD4ABE|nr:general stress protein [Sporosarcina cyprini]MCG3086546.1 general stress protein [Sporosarcina cyprini]